MKVSKFGGTSVGSAQRIKEVARLITGRGSNIIVLSAMSGTTNTLVEIADYLARRNVNGAKETINCLEKRYDEVISELLEAGEFRDEARRRIGEVFAFLRSFTHAEEFAEKDEKEILAQGELMSTNLMDLYLHQEGYNSVWLPALEFMRTDRKSVV